MLKALALSALGGCAVVAAHAQDVYVADPEVDAAAQHEGAYVDHREVVGTEVPATAATPGPRVYGWNWVEIRPEDCGTFKYWNGQYCADARYEPPPAD